MNEKKSFDEIIIENLAGKWCDGLALLEISDSQISIDNIYDNNEKNLMINNYPILKKAKIFSKVIEMNYEDAIREFKLNKKNIISPKVLTDQIVTFDGLKYINYGGNVYSWTKDNKVIVNDKHFFDSFNEITNSDFISEKEKRGKWLVF